MGKSPDAFRTISEVAEWLDTPAHVLRFWESKFSQVRPVQRAGGRRYYRPGDMLLLGGIKRLLHTDGLTIRRVQQMLASEGVKSVAALSRPLRAEGPVAGDEGPVEAADDPGPVPADAGADTGSGADAGSGQTAFSRQIGADNDTATPGEREASDPAAAHPDAADAPADGDETVVARPPLSALLITAGPETLRRRRARIAPLYERLRALHERPGASDGG